MIINGVHIIVNMIFTKTGTVPDIGSAFVWSCAQLAKMRSRS